MFNKIVKNYTILKDISKYLLLIMILPLFLSSCSMNNLFDKKEIQENSATKKQIDKNDLPEEEYEKFDDIKEITWKSEGVSYTETFKLVNSANVPFITYIPEDDWIFESKEKSVVLKQKKYGKIEIVFMDKGIEEKQAIHNFEKLISNANLEKSKEKFPTWVISFYSAQSKNEHNWHDIYAILGKYNSHYFYIYRDLDLEGAELFIPIEHKIYEQWRWKDTNESLSIPF